MRWDIGSVYKYIRKSKGITQNEVCGDYITHSNLSKFENNHSTPRYDTMELLLRQIDMSFDEFKMQGQNTSGIKQLLGKHIGYISQNYAQSFNEYTRLDKQLIAIYRYHFNVSKDNALKKIKKALTWVNLNDESIINKYSFQLSGGQLERVNIASVLMLDPELIIADEPVASLDVVNGHQIMQLLQHIVKDHHNTVLLITHNMNHVLKYADYFNVMRNGMMIESGEIDKLFNHHHLHRYTEQLLNYRSKLQKEDNI
ncbi:MAG: ATP-binding cassette domain-containing protein [Staphylococcus epidermidis]|nr:ATP-binding cassette domain-containing protein [Staphylococcus epidermidis]